jgi:hypothetical protein
MKRKAYYKLDSHFELLLYNHTICFYCALDEWADTLRWGCSAYSADMVPTPYYIALSSDIIGEVL